MENNEELIVQLKRSDLVDIIREALGYVNPEDTETSTSRRTTVFGLQGIANLLGVSRSTAARIKASGVLNPAISQVGKTIICDADLALDLLKIPSRRQSLHARALGNRTKSNLLK